MKQSYYSSKLTLLIEDQAEMRGHLKSMLERLGVENIITATNGEEAIESLKSRSYDLVFSDYELGRGKDGQQVLEEARHAKLLKEVSSFILVTAAQTVEMVMGAIEYHPDGYITKPVTYDDLKARVERILKTKIIFEPINNALDDLDLETAISECKELIEVRPKIALPVYRILSRIYLQESRYEEAEQILQAALSIREVAWASLGIAKVRYHQGKFEEGITLLEGLSNAKDRYVESQDWLAKIYEAQGDFDKAQKTLEQAIAQSPKAILRQSELSRLARINEDWAVATQAARKTVSLGKNSCHKKPNHYLHLIEGLKTQLNGSGLRDRRYVTTEIVKTLAAIRVEFPEDPNMIVRSYVLDSEIQQTLGQTKQAEQLAKEAIAHVKHFKDEISADLMVLVGKNLANTCDLKTTTDYVESEICASCLSEDQKNDIINASKKSEEAKINQKIDLLNNEGVEYFEKGSMNDAIRMFDQAARFSAASFSVLLNAVQAHIALLQKAETKHSPDQCISHLNRLSKMPQEDRRYPRYKKLLNMYEDIINADK